MILKIIKEGPPIEGKSIKTPADVYRMMNHINKEDRENFYVLHLNSEKKPIEIEHIARGTLNSMVIHPREVFKGAVLNNSAGIVCVHNHPSGSMKPSKPDKRTIQRLNMAGRTLGIPVVDHVIISDWGFWSAIQNDKVPKKLVIQEKIKKGCYKKLKKEKKD